MNRRELLTATAALAGTAATTAAVARAAAPAATDGIEHAGLPGRDYRPAVAAVRAQVMRHLADHGIPAITVAMVDADGFAAFIPAGFADVDKRVALGPDHLFQIGSITKSFAALCALILSARGQLDLNAAVVDLLPGIDVPRNVALMHLIEHSSGLPDDAPLFPRPTGGKHWQGYAPHTHWSYSNLGYTLIGMALERVSGKPFEQLVRELVFVPLGMSSARGAIRAEDRARYAQGYTVYAGDLGWLDRDRLGVAPWADVTFAAGCIAATAHDMAKYARWLIAAARGHGAPLLSDADARRFTTATVDAPGWAQPGARYGFGLATVPLDGRTMLHHTGGMIAFTSSIHVDAAAGVACFASTTLTGFPGYRPRDITSYACHMLRVAREGGVASAPKPTRAPIAAPGDYMGRFARADGRTLVLAVAGAGLRAIYPGGAAGVESPAPDLLVVRDPVWLRFSLAAERAGGKVAGYWHGGDWYGAPGSAPKPAAAPEMAALTGRYDTDNLWGGVMRIVARGDRLFADGVTPLTRLPDGSWRVGEDDWSPERIWFDGAIAGQPQRLSLSGTDYFRRADG